jgi:hypothetical protein
LLLKKSLVKIQIATFLETFIVVRDVKELSTIKTMAIILKIFQSVDESWVANQTTSV